MGMLKSALLVIGGAFLGMYAEAYAREAYKRRETEKVQTASLFGVATKRGPGPQTPPDIATLIEQAMREGLGKNAHNPRNTYRSHIESLRTSEYVPTHRPNARQDFGISGFAPAGVGAVSPQDQALSELQELVEIIEAMTALTGTATAGQIPFIPTIQVIPLTGPRPRHDDFTGPDEGAADDTAGASAPTGPTPPDADGSGS